MRTYINKIFLKQQLPCCSEDHCGICAFCTGRFLASVPASAGGAQDSIEPDRHSLKGCSEDQDNCDETEALSKSTSGASSRTTNDSVSEADGGGLFTYAAGGTPAVPGRISFASDAVCKVRPTIAARPIVSKVRQTSTERPIAVEPFFGVIEQAFVAAMA